MGTSGEEWQAENRALQGAQEDEQQGSDGRQDRTPVSSGITDMKTTPSQEVIRRGRQERKFVILCVCNFITLFIKKE